MSLIDQFCLVKIPKGKEFQQCQKNNDWIKPRIIMYVDDNSTNMFTLPHLFLFYNPL